MQDVDLGIVSGRGRDRWPAQYRHLAVLMGAAVQLVDEAALHVHAAHEHGVGPGEICVGRRRDVLVDEPHLPVARQIGGDDQQPLGRHEGAHAGDQRKGMLERPEGRRIARKDAEDAPAVRAHDGWWTGRGVDLDRSSRSIPASSCSLAPRHVDGQATLPRPFAPCINNAWSSRNSSSVSAWSDRTRSVRNNDRAPSGPPQCTGRTSAG